MPEIIQDVYSARLDRPSVLTIGSFDGVHRGHKHLIDTVIRDAKERNAASIVVTLNPHPRLVLRPDSGLLLLSTLDERLSLLKQLALDYIVVFPFTVEHSRVRAREFVQLLHDHLGMVELVCGPNFALGHKREGTIPVLRELGKELGFTVTIVEPHQAEGELISSTRVRDLVASGDVTTAAHLMGHYPIVRGIVVHGDHRGRTLGYPTANLEVADQKLIPANGIYAVRVHFVEPDNSNDAASPNGQPQLEATTHWYEGAASIGVRPTFGGGGTRLVEVYILDFNRMIYGQELEVDFVQRLRDEEKFPNVEMLLEQMARDVTNARKVLSQMPVP